MGAQPYTDDAKPTMYCLHCGEVVDTDNSVEWTLPECVHCGNVDLLHPGDAHDQGFIAE